MKITLKQFQLEAISNLHEAINGESKNIILKSGTGSGKTVILTHFINEYMEENPNYVTVWFSPGKGNLEKQSKDKMDLYIQNANTKLLSDVLTLGFNERDTVFINWELVTKKGNKALSNGEKKNLVDTIESAHNKGLKFLVVIDEEHLNKTIKSYDIIDMFNPEKIIRASATPKKNLDAQWVEIPEEKVIQEGLIKKLLIINEDIDKEVDSSNQINCLLDLALKKQQVLRREFLKNELDINPLIVVQVPNKSEDLIVDVERYFNNKNLNYENGELAVWLSDKKEGLDGIEKHNSKVKAVIIKQAVATGWDCPRAYILVKLRENMSETFEIQTIGRIRRMPEGIHYDNRLLDSCYLYTFDEKFKEGVKEHLGMNSLEGMTLMLKKEYRDIKLTKEKIPMLSYEVNPTHALEAFQYLLKVDYDLKPLKFKDNREKLKINGYNIDHEILLKTYSGEISTLKKSSLESLDRISLKVELNTHEHGRMFHRAIGKIARSIGITYDSMSVIIRKLFLDITRYEKGKILNLNARELYSFVINNEKRIESDLKKAMSDEKYRNAQLTFANNCIEEEFILPKEILFTYDNKIKDYEIYDKNVYDGYTSLGEPRSQGEKLFERFCQENKHVDWFYKNGDKGKEFFSIVYMDNSSRKHHFYPDYILSIDNNLCIIEVKGGESSVGISEDIDIFSETKMNALLDYSKRYSINCGFVRLNKSDMRLYINTDKYIDDMSDKTWKRLDRFINE